MEKTFFNVILDFRTPGENFVLVNLRGLNGISGVRRKARHTRDPTHSIKFILFSNKTESMDI